MRYDTILAEALSQAHTLPKKPVVNVKPQKPQINLEDVVAKITNNLEALSTPKVQPIEITHEITHDTAHLEALINKLGDLVAVSPTVNVATPDNAVLVDAIHNLSKLVRALQKPKAITLSVLRDEDGKMAQIIIEQE